MAISCFPKLDKPVLTHPLFFPRLQPSRIQGGLQPFFISFSFVCSISNQHKLLPPRCRKGPMEITPTEALPGIGEGIRIRGELGPVPQWPLHSPLALSLRWSWALCSRRLIRSASTNTKLSSSEQYKGQVWAIQQ